MDCRAARELLPERVLGVLEEDEADLRRHLAWCAGCRKEERELAEGAEILALVEPGDPPAGLERRVVERVAGAAGHRGRRRGPAVVAVAAVLAAVLAVGWGAAMAGRASRLDDEAELARIAAAEAAREFGVLLEDLSGKGVREAGLRPPTGDPGGGRALVYNSDVGGASDWALVVVGGLPEDAGPYRATLRGDRGTVKVGRLWPSAEGRLAAYALYGELPTDLTRVLVSDRSGAVVLRGSLAAP